VDKYIKVEQESDANILSSGKIEQRSSETLTIVDCDEILSRLPFMDISSKISDLVATTLTCTSEQKRLVEPGLEAIQVVKDSLFQMQEISRLTVAHDTTTAERLNQNSSDHKSTHQRLVELSQNVEDIGSKVDQVEIALLTLRLGLESQLASLNIRPIDSTNSHTILPSALSSASTFLTCLATSTMTTIFSTRLSIASQTTSIGCVNSSRDQEGKFQDSRISAASLDGQFERIWKNLETKPTKFEQSGARAIMLDEGTMEYAETFNDPLDYYGLWNCDDCGNGPMLAVTNPMCPSCGAQQ
jgi:hypothetical protein